MNKHTPGPWKTAGINGITVNALNGDTILACPGGSYKAEISELRANARLIAAAPDLLKALRQVMELIKTGDHITESHYGALITGWESKIAKAEGRE